MTECFNTEIREQLPEFAAGTLSAVDAALVEQHVGTCSACAEELEILRAVRDARIPVPFINVSRIVSALPPAPIPVRDELPWYRRASIQMAAAFLLVAGGLFAVREAGDRVEMRTAAKVAAVPAGQVAAEDKSVGVEGTAGLAAPPSVAPARRALADTPARSDIALVAGLDEMTTQELTSLLREVEDIAAVPVAEPEVFSPVTALSEDQGEG